MRTAPLLQASLMRTALFSNNGSSDPATSVGSLSLPPLANGSRRVYLLRHGETDWNARGLMQGGGFDIELNDNGRSQAAAVASALGTAPITTIVSSHLLRSSQTADILQEQSFPNASRRNMKQFGEMRFGSLEGLALWGPESTKETRDQFQAFNERLKQDANLQWPGGGESTAEVEARALEGLAEVLQEDNDHVAIVAHGRMNKVILASLLFGDVTRFSEILQWNTCINVIDLDAAGKWESCVINYMGHVPDYKR